MLVTIFVNENNILGEGKVKEEERKNIKDAVNTWEGESKSNKRGSETFSMFLANNDIKMQEGTAMSYNEKNQAKSNIEGRPRRNITSRELWVLNSKRGGRNLVIPQRVHEK